jgi:hypothetical protein
MVMRPNPPSGITLGQFTAAFVPFGLLLCAALLQPETTEALDLNRTKATILAASVLLIPALALYPFEAMSERVSNLAHLFWTFAYVTFLVHADWAVFVIFDGVADTFRQMGMLIAGVNFLLVIWWGIEVLLLWTVKSVSHGFAVFQMATRAFIFVVFAVTLIALRGGSVRALGIVLVVATVGSLLIRFWARGRSSEGELKTA